MSADTVARYALDASERSASPLQIPGGMDRVSVFAQRFLPRSVARRVAGRLMKPD
jgi:short-subunit dehydrogenase